MFNFPAYKRNVIQNYTNTSSHSSWSVHLQGQKQQQILAKCNKTGTLIHCWWICKSIQPLLKAVWGFFKKLK
jgi:hypothetical protein